MSEISKSDVQRISKTNLDTLVWDFWFLESLDQALQCLDEYPSDQLLDPELLKTIGPLGDLPSDLLEKGPFVARVYGDLRRKEIPRPRVTNEGRRLAWRYVLGLIENNHQQIHDVICGEWQYCKKQSDPRFQDISSLIYAVAGCLTIVFPVSCVVPVAGIMCKLGLDRFCACGRSAYCQGFTRTGKPCTRRVARKGGFCWQHASQVSDDGSNTDVNRRQA